MALNYPTNMIYAAALDSAARLYDMPELAEKAGRMRESIRKQSFDGTFFVDNALRKEDGKLEVTTNRTEACQYYAFYFGVATTESHPELWRTLVEDFGPGRKKTKAHPEIHPANFLFGNVLRLELLSRDGRARQLLDESIGYAVLTPAARRPVRVLPSPRSPMPAAGLPAPPRLARGSRRRFPPG